MPKWYTIGQNQYRMVLSDFRWIRRYFPFLVVALLAIYVVYLAPAIVGLFIDEALAFLLSHAAIALIQIILFTVFLWFFFFPVSFAMRDIQASQLELFLSAPVKPSHLLLGEFVGVMPFYTIAIVVFAGIFTAILGPLGLGVVQVAIVVLIFVLTFFAALWIGTVAAAVLRTKLGQTERGQDAAKALGFILALPVVGIMYAMMGGGLAGALSDPSASNAITGVLGILPSSWGAKLIVDFANHPGNIAAVWAETLARFGGLSLFLLASFYIGFKLADRTYSLETASFSGSKIAGEGFLYRTIRSVFRGGPFAVLLVSITKDYGRRLQNLSRVGYIIGLVVLINLFLIKPETPVSALVMAQALFALLAAFVVGEVTVRGKDALFIYRKAPRGELRLIKARLVQGWMISLPISAAITAIQLSLIPQVGPSEVILYTGVMLVVVMAYVVFTLGLFLMMPAFSDKGGEFAATSMIVVMFSAGTFIGSMVLFGRIWGTALLVALSWGVGSVLLLLGKSNLSRIE